MKVEKSDSNVSDSMSGRSASVSIAGSAVVVVLAYLPFVALKAVYVMVSGKTTVRVPNPEPSP